jgi:hypothetical protein
MTMGEGTAYAIACNGGAGGRWFHRNIAGKKTLADEVLFGYVVFPLWFYGERVGVTHAAGICEKTVGRGGAGPPAGSARLGESAPHGCSPGNGRLFFACYLQANRYSGENCPQPRFPLPRFPLSRLRERVGVREAGGKLHFGRSRLRLPSPCPLPHAGEGSLVLRPLPQAGEGSSMSRPLPAGEGFWFFS